MMLCCNNAGLCCRIVQCHDHRHRTAHTGAGVHALRLASALAPCQAAALEDTAQEVLALREEVALGLPAGTAELWGGHALRGRPPKWAVGMLMRTLEEREARMR
jgi:hypothetical protein